jgi:hypothetical protein
MRKKLLTIFLLLSLIIPTSAANASQLQDDLDSLSSKFTSVLAEKTSLLETLTDLELSVDNASGDKDTNELKKLKIVIIELIDKQDLLEKDLLPLKKSLDENCAKARKVKSETAEAIDDLGACEDAESVYASLTNSTKSFKELQKNIEVNFAKFGLNLAKPTPTPSPSAKPTVVASKKPTPKKKTTIKCIKGKSIKVITAITPKCPSGYKIKK